MDRAWRTLPDDADTLAPIYARLLALHGSNHDATLRLLRRISAPHPDIAALTVLALLHLRRGAEARAHLNTALGDFCVLPDGLLACIASEFLHHPDTATTGWMGLGSAMELVGAVLTAAPTIALQVRIGGSAASTHQLSKTPQDSHQSFELNLPARVPGTILCVDCNGQPLLGSGLNVPSDFGLDGRTLSKGRRVLGWARVGWLPTLPPELCLEDEDHRRHVATVVDRPRSELHWPFDIDLRQTAIRGNRITISARMPDGHWQPLPETPLLLETLARPTRGAAYRLGRWRDNESPWSEKGKIKSAAGIDIIIPVYRGLQESLACIHAALGSAVAARIVVVDDATDDVALATALNGLEADGHITLLRNVVNLGFVGSVNRALARSRTHDAVLLNSDALVFGDWLERLRKAAYSGPRVGTVTPFSNSGSIASYPHDQEHSMSADEAAQLHGIATAINAQISQEIPVGVGFCLYLRSDCLREVGEFDASLFGKGYGEETDFCLRARSLGWSHRLAADVFVHHAGGRSFGSRRAALLDRSQRLINLRHPGYDAFIADFLAKDPLLPLRRRMDERRLTGVEGRFMLLTTLALSGGVQRFVNERCSAIRLKGRVPLILRPYEADSPRWVELWTDAIDVPNLRYDIPSNLEELTTLLKSLPIDEVEIQHFLHLDPRVVNMARALDAPYDVYVHDYAWICPRITLIDGSGRYCAEPALSVCETCVRRNGSQLGEKISVAGLRQRSAVWLQEARCVIAPSNDTAARLEKYFSVSIEVRPHSVPGTNLAQSRPKRLSKIVRVAVIGAIGEHKGYRFLLNSARDAKRRRLPIEFVVIGYTEDDKSLLDTGKVFITGRYSEGEALHLLRREKPDIAFLPSVYPETWCYALDEALAADLPVVAFDIGAIAERVRNLKTGSLLPMSLGPGQINDRLLRVATQGRSYIPPTHVATRGSLDLINMNNKTPEHDSAHNQALSASVQILPLPPGLYLFSVKAATTVTDATPGQLRLPAMHVGMGPGVSSEQVEFIAGPVTKGAWLFAQEDLMVIKVTHSAATLILTSVRAPGGEVLSIKVERLDGRTDAPDALSVAAAPVLAPVAPRIATTRKEPKSIPEEPVAGAHALPMSIGTHIRARGDMTFTDVPWAGRAAPGLWIESFSVKPLEGLAAEHIEYKGLTGSGFETPWLSDDKMCGTKGMSVPLVGFAVRLRSSPKTSAYDCEYSGYFKSGTTVGPLRNGAPCRSSVANDPLEGIQIHVVKRAGTGKANSDWSAKVGGDSNKSRQAVDPMRGPSFGRYRGESGVPLGNGSAAKPKANAATLPSAKKSAKPNSRTTTPSRKSNGSAVPSQRSSDRRS